MRTMPNQSRKFAVLAALAAFMLPATATHAQYYGSLTQPPLYPYAMQSDQPYAVEVSPGTYVIKRTAPARDYPYVRSQSSGRGIINTVAAPRPGTSDRPHKPVDHALVEELRSRHQAKEAAVNGTKIVRDAPVVVEHQRIVDDPPRVITRRHIVEDQPDGSQITTVEDDAPPNPSATAHASRADTKKRVI